MKIIGITGGIGSGKSKVLDILSDKYGAYIVEADKIAYTLMQPGYETYDKIISCFGDDIKDPETLLIDRSKLAKIVMNDRESLNKLNSIVHPDVKSYINKDIADKRENGEEYYIIEAALLIQDNYQLICDEIWSVLTDKELRISRLMNNRGFSREKALDFMKNQPDDDYYSENSDRIIYNNGDVSDLIKSIDENLHM